MKDRKLQSLCETYEAVKAVTILHPALLVALENILKGDKSADTKAEAKGILGYLSSLECLFLLQMWIQIPGVMISAEEIATSH